MKRCNDLKSIWYPSSDTHRGRLRIEFVRNTKVAQLELKLLLAQKPSKTYQSGEGHFENGFVIDKDYDALTAGMALCKIILHDPEVGRD